MTDVEDVQVRVEQPRDFATVDEINRRAFEGPDEARLVQRLRGTDEAIISLVGTRGGQVLGHILFTPVEVRGAGATRRAIALGPMAVDPRHQRQGVGSALVRAGVAACRRVGWDVIFVVGHADYYPRFGFVPAAPAGLRYESDKYDPYFMMLELKPGAARGLRGHVHYLPAFGGA